MQFRNAIAEGLIKKNNDEFEQALFENIQFSIGTSKVNKILVVGTENTRMLETLCGLDIKVDGIDMSRDVVKLAKNTMSKYRNINIISKDFLKNSYDKVSYDLIILSKQWLHIPLDSEGVFVDALYSLASEQSKILIGSKFGETVEQKWEGSFVSKNEYFYLKKTNNQKEFVSTFKKKGFDLEKETTYAGVTYSTFGRDSIG
jgi:2-polyprenyl-3-methyl-5-hydroxy-6-metoxy-1,4-benzoquinol methylase